MIPLRNTKRFLAKALQQPGYACSVFGRRARAYLACGLGSGRSFAPEAVTIFLTHRCNLHCQMCGQWGERGVTRTMQPEALASEMSRDELIHLVDRLADFSPNITLFGGEPLLFDGCMDLIRHIKQKRMHCLMITNGSLLERFAGDIVASGLDELNVSLDGPALLHNEIRGMPGCFERIMAGLAKVNFYKDQAKSKRPLINLQCTITRYNYHQLEQMLEVCRLARADSLTFHNLIFLSEQEYQRQLAFDRLLECSSQGWQGFVSDPGIDPQKLAEKMQELRQLPWGVAVDFFPNFSVCELKDYYHNPCYLPPAQNRSCLSPWLVAYIFPDGEVRPCLNFSYSFGNVKKDGFARIWNSPKAVKFRRFLKQRRMFPACVRCTELYRY